jgi:hypothetical protein
MKESDTYRDLRIDRLAGRERAGIQNYPPVNPHFIISKEMDFGKRNYYTNYFISHIP